MNIYEDLKESKEFLLLPDTLSSFHNLILTERPYYLHFCLFRMQIVSETMPSAEDRRLKFTL